MDKVKSKDETTIAYLRDSSGPPLVLVHGSGSIAKRWNTVMPALTKDFTVFSMEVLPRQKHMAMVTASELFVKVLKNSFWKRSIKENNPVVKGWSRNQSCHHLGRVRIRKQWL